MTELIWYICDKWGKYLNLQIVVYWFMNNWSVTVWVSASFFLLVWVVKKINFKNPNCKSEVETSPTELGARGF